MRGLDYLVLTIVVLIATTLAIEVVDYTENQLLINPKLARSVLSRGKRANSGLFEEWFGNANFQEECVNEQCLFEECKEAFPDNEETAREQFNTVPYRQCWGNETQCSAEGTLKCINFIDSRVCQCKEGFHNATDTGDCIEEDECKTQAPCGECKNSVCANTVGSFTCSCQQGYEADGDVNPEASCNDCKDIDECSKDAGLCDACSNTECTNKPGSFECGCKKGFVKKGDMGVDDVCYNCEDLDECEDEDACGNNEVCKNTIGSFECECAEGFTKTNVSGCIQFKDPQPPSFDFAPSTIGSIETTAALETTPPPTEAKTTPKATTVAPTKIAKKIVMVTEPTTEPTTPEPTTHKQTTPAETTKAPTTTEPTTEAVPVTTTPEQKQQETTEAECVEEAEPKIEDFDIVLPFDTPQERSEIVADECEDENNSPIGKKKSDGSDDAEYGWTDGPDGKPAAYAYQKRK